MADYCVLSVFLSAIPAVLAAVSVPWGWEVVGGLRGGLSMLAVGSGNGRGSGKRDGASQDGGRALPHIRHTPPRTFGGGGKQAGGLSAIRA